jgi:hypothetical protein
MKDNIQIALLAVIAAATVFMAIGQRNAPAAAPVPDPSARTSMPAGPPPAAAQHGFDPLTPPVKPEPAPYVGPVTNIGFKAESHDFGKIKQDSENHYVFNFINTGQEPLVISNAVGSCGCTVPEYPKHPIAPGETGEINVVYKPGKQEGQQNKTVTVTANTEPAQTVLRILADVQKVN